MNKKILINKKTKNNIITIITYFLLYILINVIIILIYLVLLKDIKQVIQLSYYWITILLSYLIVTIGIILKHFINKKDEAQIIKKQIINNISNIENLNNNKKILCMNLIECGENISRITLGLEKNDKNLKVVQTYQKNIYFHNKYENNKILDLNIYTLIKGIDKPNLVHISNDNKMYNKYIDYLIANNYKVHLVNFKSLNNTINWSPIDTIKRKIKEIIELQNKLKITKGKYETTNDIYLSYHDTRERIKQLKNKINNDIDLLISNLCINKKQSNKIVDHISKEIISSLFLSLVIDFINERINLLEFNTFNVFHIINNLCNNDYTKLKDFINKNIKELKHIKNFNNFINKYNEEEIKSSLYKVSNYCQAILSNRVLLTNNNDSFDLFNIDENKNIIFIIIDEKYNRNDYATLLINQIIEEAKEKSETNFYRNQTNYIKLKRNLFILIDEFSNESQIRSINNDIGIRYLISLNKDQIIPDNELNLNIKDENEVEVLIENIEPLRLSINYEDIVFRKTKGGDTRKK